MDLPKEIVGELVCRGQILHSDIFDDIEHPKFFIIIGIYEDCIAGFFYINSDINRFINTKEDQLLMQYPLYVNDYKFLSHDSFICATNIIKLKKSIITQSIIDNRTKVVDSLRPDHLATLWEK